MSITEADLSRFRDTAERCGVDCVFTCTTRERVSKEEIRRANIILYFR